MGPPNIGMTILTRTCGIRCMRVCLCGLWRRLLKLTLAIAIWRRPGLLPSCRVARLTILGRLTASLCSFVGETIGRRPFVSGGDSGLCDIACSLVGSHLLSTLVQLRFLEQQGSNTNNTLVVVKAKQTACCESKAIQTTLGRYSCRVGGGAIKGHGRDGSKSDRTAQKFDMAT